MGTTDSEEALQLYDLSVNISLGEAHVRIKNLPELSRIRDLKSRHINTLVSIVGQVSEASDVDPQAVQAAYECQRCGTLTRIPQTSQMLQEPHKCTGCERQGPFRLNTDQSEFIDKQIAVINDLAAPASEPPESLEIHLEDDIAGDLASGDVVKVTCVLHLTQQNNSTQFNRYLEVDSIADTIGPDLASWSDSYLDIDSTTDRSSLEDFVYRSRLVLNQHETLNETAAKTKIITPFISVLGWNVFEHEVQLEYEGNSEIADRVDYALLDSDAIPRVVVEAKRVERDLDNYTGQLRRYIRLLGSEWGVLTNGERYIVMRKFEDESTPDETCILDCELESLLKNQDVIPALSRSHFYNGPN